MTQEEICRKILHQAIHDGLVTFNGEYGAARCVHDFTAGDLVGVANLLTELTAPQTQAEVPAPLITFEKPRNPDDDIPF